MDYQEAIYCMKVMADEEVCEDCNYYQLCDHTKQADMARIAISAMQELQSLHEQGISLERLKDIDFRKEVVEHINYMEYMSIKDELEEYKQLGTLEEVREAMEKQAAISREIIEGKYFCPKCHNLMPYPGYCGCGQKLY